MYGALLGCYEFLGSCTDDYGFWRNSCSVGVVSGSSNWTRVCGFHAWGLGVITHEELLACVVSMFEGRCQLEFWCCGG
jgi:predicted branched-subunit amino acid permease